MTEEDLILYKFLGILFGVAVRTKKPLDLHLAPLVWKQLVGIPLSPDDIEEVHCTPLLLYRIVVSLYFLRLIIKEITPGLMRFDHSLMIVFLPG